MADLIHSSLRENNLKRLFYTPHLLVIDTWSATGVRINREEAKTKVEQLVKLAQRFGFDVSVTSLEKPEELQKVDSVDKFEYTLPSEDATMKLHESVSSITENTARDELLKNLHAQVLIKIAKVLDCKKIFVSDSATSIAVTLMSGE